MYKRQARTPFIVLVMAFVFALARPLAATRAAAQAGDPRKMGELGAALVMGVGLDKDCLLYTSDAADERSSVDLGGRRIIKKKNRSRQKSR